LLFPADPLLSGRPPARKHGLCQHQWCAFRLFTCFSCLIPSSSACRDLTSHAPEPAAPEATLSVALPLEQCCPLPVSEFAGFHGYCHSAVAVARGLRTSGLLGGAPKASLLELITQNLAVMQKSWQLLSLHPENRADVSGFLQT